MRIESYRVVERLSDGLFGIESRYGQQLWSAGKTRKDTRCARCRKDIKKGTNAFRTVNASTQNRNDRLCNECVRG
jgi:hypothetical protein